MSMQSIFDCPHLDPLLGALATLSSEAGIALATVTALKFTEMESTRREAISADEVRRLIADISRINDTLASLTVRLMPYAADDTLCHVQQTFMAPNPERN